MYESISQSSDATLVIAVGRNSMAALEELFRRHGGAVLALARRVTRDPHRAEEVCQTVFTDLWRSPERYDRILGIFLEELARWEAGDPLENIVDVEAGY